MSKVLNALDVSEQSYQATTSSPFQASQVVAEVPQKSSKLLMTLLLLVPPTCTATYALFGAYQDSLTQWQAENRDHTVVEQVPYSVTQLAPMVFEELRSTYEISPVVEVRQPEVVAREMDSLSEPDIASEPPSLEPFLEEIDLSELSPELALRIESALDASQPQRDQEHVSNLTQQARHWQGKLPPLDFQTHVYSSNPAKRWVKVNGVEYREGDEIAQGVILERIEQTLCQIRFEGEVVEIPALYDWQG